MSRPVYYALLSGGLDSTTALALAVEMAYDVADVHAISIDYGQRHKRELESAKAIAKYYGISHEIVEISMPRTMLTDPSIAVPHVSYADIKGVSPTYVPFRNGRMLSTLASIIAGRHLDPTMKNSPEFGRDCFIYWGAHADDAAGDAYPDCSIPFVEAMNRAIEIGTYDKVHVVTPFVRWEKSAIVLKAKQISVPIHLSWSCYEGGEKHCGQCATCRARKEAFEKAGVQDPTIYENLQIAT